MFEITLKNFNTGWHYESPDIRGIDLALLLSAEYLNYCMMKFSGDIYDAPQGTTRDILYNGTGLTGPCMCLYVISVTQESLNLKVEMDAASIVSVR